VLHLSRLYIKRNDICKHLIFVLVKVIGLSTNDPLSFQKAYLPSEVHHLLQLARERRVGGSVLANRQVQEQFAKVVVQSVSGEQNDNNSNEHIDDEYHHGVVQRRSLEQDSDCPICFDEMTDLSETTYCRAQCGFNFHSKCIRLWCQRTTTTTTTATSTGTSGATCPACRQPWQEEDDDSTAAAAAAEAASSNNKRRAAINEEGYVNLGRLQGQSPQRDSSTYYNSPWRNNGGGGGYYYNGSKRSRPRYNY
jgi:Ring finger domain